VRVLAHARNSTSVRPVADVPLKVAVEVEIEEFTNSLSASWLVEDAVEGILSSIALTLGLFFI